MNTQAVINELRYCAGLCHYYNDMSEMRDPTGERTNEEIARSYLLMQAASMSRDGWPLACNALGRAGTADVLSLGGAWITECWQEIEASDTGYVQTRA